MEKTFAWSSLPGALLKRWPRDDAGEYAAPKFLTHCLSVDMEDKILVNMLEAYGIPTLIIHPGDGDFGKVLLGMSGTGSSILVPEPLYEDAKALMEAESDDELES